MAKNDPFSKYILYLSIVMMTYNTIDINAKSCIEGLSDELHIEVGNSVTVPCILTDHHGSNETSSNALYFKLNNQSLPDKDVEFVNSSYIRLHVKNPPRSKSVYTCISRTKSKPVCSNTVIVESRPLPVDDFKCVSYNLQVLTCTWTPIESYMKVNYHLLYSPGNRKYSRHTCPNIVVHNGQMNCTWDIFGTPQYRQAYVGLFYFELSATNDFGSTITKRIYNHSALVLPDPPEQLECINKTSTSVHLHWSVPLQLQPFPLGLEHRIMYRSQFGQLDYQVGGYLVTNQKTNENYIYFNLTDLKYAYAAYDIKVSMRSTTADRNDNTMWSKNSTIVVRTMPKKPAMPPLTNAGSFEITSSSDNNETIIVYWQPIPKELENGGNFEYYIEMQNDSRYNVSTAVTYAEFKHLKRDEDYTFYVWSNNNVGKSEDRSIVHIPKSSKRVEQPMFFTKTELLNGYYALSWEEPRKSKIKSYTIFWCTHNEDRPYQCKNPLNWVEIPGNQTAYNTTLTITYGKLHQFAISANSDEFSSGIVWACPIVYKKSVPKLQDIRAKPIDATTVKIVLRLKCSDGISSVKTFVVHYCNISSETEDNCIESEEILSIPGDSSTKSIVINGLKPYSTYKVAVSVINRYGVESLKSDYQVTKTPDDAPDLPKNLSIVTITNSSIFIVWRKPNITNGVLKDYIVEYTDNSENITTRIATNDEQYNITNLKSYIEYSIVVKACTSKCSKPAEIRRVRTREGYPSRLLLPKVQFKNDTDCIIEWKPPENPNGNNGTYQLMLKRNGYSALINVTDTEYNIKDCAFDTEYGALNISVRALNIFDQIWYGPWSEELQLYCGEPTEIWLWTLLIILFLFVMAIGYGTRRTYLCWKEMRKVEIELPPGIALMLDTQLPLQNGTHMKNEKRRSSPNEELYEMIRLLDRKISADELDGENLNEKNTCNQEIPNNVLNTKPAKNGCSSGEKLHQVDNFNRRSTLGISNMPTRASSETNLQRTFSTPYIKRDYVCFGDGKLHFSKATSPNYCVLGIDAVPNKSTNPNYIPSDFLQQKLLFEEQSSFPNSTSHYVQAGELNKFLN